VLPICRAFLVPIKVDDISPIHKAPRIITIFAVRNVLLRDEVAIHLCQSKIENELHVGF